MKKYLCGLISGVFVTSMLLIMVFAADIKAIINPFPVKVNGKEAKVEAYSINGRTYFNGRDIAQYLGGQVEFNEKDRVIEITQPQTSAVEKEYYSIGETAINDKFEVTLLSIDYLPLPPMETKSYSWYWSQQDYQLCLVKYNIKNITNYEVKTPTVIPYLDEHLEKPYDIISGVIKAATPNYYIDNDLGYKQPYINSDEAFINTIDLIVKKSDNLKTIVIGGLCFNTNNSRLP